MGFILSYIALLLFVVIYVFDGVIELFIDVRGRKWYKTVSKRKYTKAFAIDVFGNYLFKATWTFLFSWNQGYSFGKWGETISSCLGRKKLEHTLSWIGLFFYYLLFIVDYTKWDNGGHCVASIMSEEEINKFLK